MTTRRNGVSGGLKPWQGSLAAALTMCAGLAAAHAASPHSAAKRVGAEAGHLVNHALPHVLFQVRDMARPVTDPADALAPSDFNARAASDAVLIASAYHAAASRGAALFSQSGNLDAAWEILNEARYANPRLRIQRAVVAARRKDFASAQKDLDAVLREDSLEARAFYPIVLTIKEQFAAAGHDGGAPLPAMSARKVLPVLSVDDDLRMIRLTLNDKNYMRAALLFEEASARYKSWGDLEAQWRLAEAMAEAGAVSRALDLVEDVAEDDNLSEDTRAMAWREAAKLAEAGNDLPRWIMALQRAHALSGDEADLQAVMAVQERLKDEGTIEEAPQDVAEVQGPPLPGTDETSAEVQMASLEEDSQEVEEEAAPTDADEDYARDDTVYETEAPELENYEETVAEEEASDDTSEDEPSETGDQFAEADTDQELEESKSEEEPQETAVDEGEIEETPEEEPAQIAEVEENDEAESADEIGPQPAEEVEAVEVAEVEVAAPVRETPRAPRIASAAPRPVVKPSAAEAEYTGPLAETRRILKLKDAAPRAVRAAQTETVTAQKISPPAQSSLTQDSTARAEHLLRTGDCVDGLAAYRGLGQTAQLSAAAHRAAAECFQADGKTTDALVSYNLALSGLSARATDERAAIWKQIAELQEERGNDKAAARAWGRAAAGKGDAPAKLSEVRTLRLAGRADDATKALTRINPTKLPEDQRPAYYDELASLLQSQDPDGAVAALFHAIALENTADRYRHIARIYQAQGRMAARMAVLRKGAQLHPGDAELRSALAYAYVEEDKPGRAVRHFEAALEREPKDAKLASDYAYALKADRQYEKAAKAFRVAVDRFDEEEEAKRDPATQNADYALRGEFGHSRRAFEAEGTFLYQATDTAPVFSQFEGRGEQSHARLRFSWAPNAVEEMTGLRLAFIGSLLGTVEPHSINLDEDTAQARLGLRVQPIDDLDLAFSAERLFGLGDAIEDNWLFSTSFSWGDGLEYREGRSMWNYSAVSAEIIGAIAPDFVSLYGELVQGRSLRIAERLVLTPQAVLAARFYGDDIDSQTLIEAGIGTSLRYWFRRDETGTPLSYADITLQYRHYLSNDLNDEDGRLYAKFSVGY